MTYVNLALKICRMNVNMIYYDCWSGKLKNSYVWMICNGVGVVCHSGIYGCNLYVEHEHYELLLEWLQLSLCCDLEWPLYES